MSLAGAVRRNERALIVAWLASCAVLLGVIGVWGVGLGGAERAIDLWNERWIPRIERAEELLAAGQVEEAALHFERLDRDLPAIFVKHRLDRERERVLEQLGTAYLQLDKKRRSLDAFERLVDFDPRNWHNHFVRANALAHFGESADGAYADVLTIHPNHRPSVQARITARFEGGRYADVAEPYEAYLDAWLLAPMSLQIGDTPVPFEVLVDGRTHVVEVPVELADGWSGELCLRTSGYSVQLESIELIGPLFVGRAEPAESTVVRGTDDWRALDAELAGPPMTWSAGTAQAALCASGIATHPTTRVRIALAAYKAVPAELWEMVEKSYENTLAREPLEAARARTVLGGCLEAGSIFVE
jgi:hypothetical protein